MDNQHRKISGYRELTQLEIDLMNEVKLKGEELKILINKIDSHLELQKSTAIKMLESNRALGVTEDEDLTRINDTQPTRWLALARSDLQTGLMKLTRAIAQPTTF